jgi:hypothetical protein
VSVSESHRGKMSRMAASEKFFAIKASGFHRKIDRWSNNNALGPYP